jgi:hypothetical protein
MIEDRFVDLNQADSLWMVAWRCVNCGEVLDAVIHHHRSLPSLELAVKGWTNNPD